MKKAILSCLMLMGVLSVSAQEQKGTTEYVFEPHWYFQLQGGAQYTTGETNFGDLISPTIQGAIGYQFSDKLGARLAINAWQSRGGYQESGYLDNSVATVLGDCNYKYTYVAPAIDLTFNLSNIIAGFNPNRKVDFGAFIGVGLNFRSSSDEAAEVGAKVEKYANQGGTTFAPMPWGTDAKTFFLGQAGLTADFKLTEALSIGLELNANVLSDKYNFKRAGNPDSYFNLLAGIKYCFGSSSSGNPTYSLRFIPAPEPEIRYVDKIVEKIVEVPAPTPVTEPLRRDIFFEINKTIIRDSEKQKVQDVADYMNAHPTAKVMITGYADAGTGNDRINDRLAAGRAAAVVKALKEQYGIAESRISYDSKGSRVQPFAENDLNRVSICIAE